LTNEALHWQAVIVVLPNTDAELAGHTVHAAGPVVFLKVPAAHSVHTVPFAPVYPALHAHASGPLAAGESELSGHA